MVVGKKIETGIARGYEVSHFIKGPQGVFYGFSKKEVKEIIQEHLTTDFDRSSGLSTYTIKSVNIYIKLK